MWAGPQPLSLRHSLPSGRERWSQPGPTLSLHLAPHSSCREGLPFRCPQGADRLAETDVPPALLLGRRPRRGSCWTQWGLGTLELPQNALCSLISGSLQSLVGNRRRGPRGD